MLLNIVRIKKREKRKEEVIKKNIIKIEKKWKATKKWRRFPDYLISHFGHYI